jgi:serine/threonine protein kinase/WD40 repeat protein
MKTKLAIPPSLPQNEPPQFAQGTPMPGFDDDQQSTVNLAWGKLLVERLKAEERGELLDGADVVAAGPDAADQLREFLAGRAEVESHAKGLALTDLVVGHQEFPRRFGNFELLEEIARGGRGIVYRAEQLNLNRLVAIKVILEGELASSSDKQRFIAEAQAVAKLKHPNIVAVYDSATVGDQCYFAMELVEGQSLADVIRDQPLAGQVAAGYVADIAKAIQFAHDNGILHRDLKPSNVLLSAAGQIKVTDFGFAKQLNNAEQQTITGQILGTPSYMPPEQALGDHSQLGPTTDVYAIGALLYELLTGRPPFRAESTMETLRQVIELDPPAPRTLNPSVPRELEIITLKCLAKHPLGRYASAKELGDDVERYLRDEPIQARPPSVSGRLWRWSRRNRGWAAAILLSVATLVAMSIATLLISNAMSVSAGRESLLQMQSIEPATGWSDRVWDVVVQAANVGKDHTLQSQAILSLSGLDAERATHYAGFGGEQVVWNESGSRLLMATITNTSPPIRGVQEYDCYTGKLASLGSMGDGPIAYLPGDVPVQLAMDEARNAFELRRLSDRKLLHRYSFSADRQSAAAAQPVFSADGSAFAAAIVDEAGKKVLLVWSQASPEVPPVRITRDVEAAECTALALSPDGKLLATGDAAGHLQVLNISTASLVRQFRVGRHRIHCLSFARDKLTTIGIKPQSLADEWLIATGDAGGHVAVWNAGTGTPRAFCHGSTYDVYQVAFSPDGMTLASAGRGPARLWDLATGRQLLEISSNDFAIALAFSPDARRLAIGSQRAFSPGDVAIWDLQFHRGVKQFRGLAAPISKLAYSADEQVLAVLAHDWQVGIWTTKTGTLQCVLDMPAGMVADNAAIALNADGTELAFSSGASALVVRVADGSVIEQWKLPSGYADLLSFHSPQELRLFRMEGFNGRRVAQIRNLRGKTPLEPLATITDFARHVFMATSSPSQPYVVIDGLGGDDGKSRLLRAYDWTTGKCVSSLPTATTAIYSTLAMDSARPVVAALVANVPAKKRIDVFDLPGGEVRLSTPVEPLALFIDKDLVAAGGSGVADNYGVTLYRLATAEPLATFDVNAAAPAAAMFNSDGSEFVWGRRDGTVAIADLERVRAHLKSVQLEW